MEPPRDTRFENLARAEADGRRGRLNDRILEYFHADPRRQNTRNELAVILHIRLASVCSSVDELLKRNMLKEVGVRLDTITKHSARVLAVVPDVYQEHLPLIDTPCTRHDVVTWRAEP